MLTPKSVILVATLFGVATFCFGKSASHGVQAHGTQAPRPIANRGPGILDPKAEEADIKNFDELAKALQSLNRLNGATGESGPSPVGERKPNSLRSMQDY